MQFDLSLGLPSAAVSLNRCPSFSTSGPCPRGIIKSVCVCEGGGEGGGGGRACVCVRGGGGGGSLLLSL